MKNIFYYLFLSLIFLVSCSKDQTGELTYNEQDFVSFEKITVTDLFIGEDQTEGKIQVSISKPQSSETIINLTIVEESLNVGYSLTSNQVIIPAGEVTGYIVFIPLNDNINTPSTKLNVTISSVNNGLNIGLAEEGSYFKNVTIVNDDCPTKFNFWFGDITCEDVGYGSTLGLGSANASGDCDILNINNDLPGAGGTAITSNFNFLLTPDFPGSTTGFVTSAPTYMGDRNFTIGGVSTPCEMLYYLLYGTYDETTKTIETDYYMRVKSKSTGTVYNWYSGSNKITKP